MLQVADSLRARRFSLCDGQVPPHLPAKSQHSCRFIAAVAHRGLTVDQVGGLHRQLDFVNDRIRQPDFDLLKYKMIV